MPQKLEQKKKKLFSTLKSYFMLHACSENFQLLLFPTYHRCHHHAHHNHYNVDIILYWSLYNKI